MLRVVGEIVHLIRIRFQVIEFIGGAVLKGLNHPLGEVVGLCLFLPGFVISPRANTWIVSAAARIEQTVGFQIKDIAMRGSADGAHRVVVVIAFRPVVVAGVRAENHIAMLLRTVLQHGQETLAIQAVRNGLPSRFKKGGQDICQVDHGLGLAARLDDARPARHERNAQAGIVKIPLAKGQVRALIG